MPGQTLTTDAFVIEKRPPSDAFQMLGLFSSIELGLKPDTPSPNGIISRVVEKFAIYA